MNLITSTCCRSGGSRVVVLPAFLLRLLCATGCYGRTFDTSRRGWFDQTGAKDASVAWPILCFGTRVQSGKELGNPNPH